MLDAELGVEDGHLDGGRGHARVGGTGEEGRDPRRLRQVTVTGPSGLGQAGQRVVHKHGPHVNDRRVDRGAIGQRRALPPALGFVGDYPQKDQRPGAVRTRRGADGLAQLEVQKAQLDTVQAHRQASRCRGGAPIGSGLQPGWRNR